MERLRGCLYKIACIKITCFIYVIILDTCMCRIKRLMQELDKDFGGHVVGLKMVNPGR